MSEQHTDSERAKRLMAMGQMAATLAHEIRNPLGSMELFCSLLKKDLADEPERFNLAEQIHVSIRRLDRVISNCLQFAREIVPRKSVVAEPVSLVAEAIENAKASLETTNVVISLEEIGTGVVEVDSYQLNQAILNLIINAAQAAEKVANGSVRVCSNLNAADSWVIEVSDNGTGIAKEQLEMIFDPFFTTKPKGTGLGLAIVHAIVKAHNGSIEVDSDAQGTTFTVRLPRK